jgi:hypothetical protein
MLMIESKWSLHVLGGCGILFLSVTVRMVVCNLLFFFLLSGIELIQSLICRLQKARFLHLILGALICLWESLSFHVHITSFH